MGLSRQEHWSGLPCPLPGDLPDRGIEPMSLSPPALQEGSSLLVPRGKAQNKYKWSINRFKVFNLTSKVHKVVCLRQYDII